MNKYSCDYLVIIHRLFIDDMPKKGGMDIIIDFLLDKGVKICLVEHSLESSGSSIFSIRAPSGKIDIIRKINGGLMLGPFRWLWEVFVTVSFIFRNLNFIPYCIAVDPLNALQAFILKWFKKVGRIYFHCIDYSKRRFKNYLLNNIYQNIYRFALNRSDVCGMVSRRMGEYFSTITKDKNKLFFIPNSPIFKEYNIDLENRNKYCVVIMSGRVDNKTNYKSIIDILAGLKMDFPRVEFKIIAKIENTEYLNRLKKYINKSELKDNVHFLGFFPNPSDLSDILVNCGVGITSYSFDTKGYHTEYGDSLKIREYAVYGLPIVADDTTDTAFEAQEHSCGFVVNNEVELKKALRILWEDDTLYQEYSQNAIKWARENDKDIILKKLIERLNV